jgi:hypothetical protein
MRSRLRWLAIAIAQLPMLFAVVTLVVLDRADHDMVESDLAFDAGQLELSLRHARRAATSYVPGAAHLDLAYSRMRAIAVGAERSREPELALLAWRAVRTSALETRHLWVPRAADLSEADRHLHRLLGQPGAAAQPEPARGVPAAVRTLGLVLGFAAMVWGLIELARSSLSRVGEFTGIKRAPAALVIAGLVTAATALVFA